MLLPGGKCATVFLPHMIGIYSLCWSSVGGQTGIYLVFAHLNHGWISLSACMIVIEGELETLEVWEFARVRVCVSRHVHVLRRIGISWLHMHVFSLIRQSSVETMRGDERGMLWPWQEIRDSSDARLHLRCVTPVSPRHAHTVMRWDTVTGRVCVCVSAIVLLPKSFWQSSQLTNGFSFLLAPLCHFIHILFHL